MGSKKSFTIVFQMLVWRVVQKHLHLKAYKLSILQDVEDVNGVLHRKFMSCESKAEPFVGNLIGNEKLCLKSCKHLFRVIYWWNSEAWVQPTDFICCRNATGREKTSLIGYNFKVRLSLWLCNRLRNFPNSGTRKFISLFAKQIVH
jgi:hypothetical protein